MPKLVSVINMLPGFCRSQSTSTLVHCPAIRNWCHSKRVLCEGHGELFVDNLHRFLGGEELRNVVNK